MSEVEILRLTALFKETGFIEIPSESFPVRDEVIDFQKSNVKITLNGQSKQIHWPEQNVTEKFIPPIITMVEFRLDEIIKEISEQIQIGSRATQSMLPLAGERKNAKGIVFEKSEAGNTLRLSLIHI